MLAYEFPKHFRPTTLEERKIFYEKDFRYEDVKNWFKQFRDYEMSISLDLGVETGIVNDAINSKAKFLRIGVVPLGELKNLLLKYLPEDVYYDRYLYRDTKNCHLCAERKTGKCFLCNSCDGQELLFDIDPENYCCPKCDSQQDSRVFSFCELCLNAAKDGVRKLYDYLSKHFDKLQIMFSGRGYHIHVLDKKAFYFTQAERYDLVKKIKSLGVGIDSHISTGEIYLVRMPFSLNGLVSRVALPVDRDKVDKFDPRSVDAIPSFLK